MAQINCSACEEIRENVPQLICNGFDDSMCESLGNNTGLNPDSGNTTCEDLHNMNDCFVGNQEAEVDLYEVCDWKTFMKQFIPNLWTTLKGIICSICGLFDRTDALCEMMNAFVAPPLESYGIMPFNSENNCGSKSSKVVVKEDDDTLPVTKADQCIGLLYGRVDTQSCSGETATYEWIAPATYLVELKDTVSNGDILWKCDKTTFQAKTGMTDELWHMFTISNWVWRNCYMTPSRAAAWLEVCIGREGLTTDEIGIIYHGTLNGVTWSGNQTLAPRGAEEARVYKTR